MTNQEIKELLRIFNESDVAEMEVQRGNNRLRLRRAEQVKELVVAAPAVPPASVPGPTTGKSAAESVAVPSNEILVKSPIVGTFYESSAPGTAPFVKVGDHVEPGQILCIIESMKLMNEIEAETSGIVESKLVINGQPVEYGEALFSVRTV
jgi:acetyl-CoA carboxylase biotin carboxyl carrier protein